MDEYQRRLRAEKDNEKAMGLQMNQQAATADSELRQIELEKRKAYANQLAMDIDQRNKLRQLDQYMQRQQ